MTDEIRFKGNITVDDAIRVDRLLVPRAKIWSRDGIVIIAMLIMIGLAICSVVTSWFSILISLCIMGAFLSFMFWYMEWSTLKSKKEFYSKQLENKEGDLTRERVLIITKSVKSELQWNMFNKFVVLEDIMFAAKDKDYIAFTPYMFQSKQDWELCRDLIYEILIQQVSKRKN